jgi:GNAT superfamily N-acetyltransferase
VSDFLLRGATPADAPVILKFVRELARHVRNVDAVRTDSALRAQLSDPRPPFECLLIEQREGGDGPVGFALFFQTYSTWLGRVGMWLEDLYITPRARKRGAGTLTLRHLARLCVERGYGRLEWNSRKDRRHRDRRWRDTYGR